MRTPRIELVALDIAGTTIDEGQEVYRVLEQTVLAHGATPSPQEIAAWHGADKRAALRALVAGPGGQELATEELECVVADFRSRLAAAYAARPPRPLPGVTRALDALRRAGVRIALTTGFDHEILDTLLPAVGWDGDAVVDTVVCSSDVPAGRPAPYMIYTAMQRLGVSDVSRVLVAGDTSRDLQAGTNAAAGMIVGVLSGAGDLAELGSHPHTHLVQSVAELPGLLGVPTAALTAA